MRSRTLNRLDKEAMESPEAFGGPVGDGEVAKAETRIGTPFLPAYRDFLLRYGGAQLGNLFVYGLRRPELGGGDFLVTTITEKFRNELPSGLKSMVVISVDQGGNPIGYLPGRSTILLWDHNTGETEVVAESLEDFLDDLMDMTS